MKIIFSLIISSESSIIPEESRHAFAEIERHTAVKLNENKR